MNWKKIESIENIEEADKRSYNDLVLIFKNSTKCGISSSVLSGLEGDWNEEEKNYFIPYYLDILRFRNLSDEIEERYNVVHESPQVLILKNGKCIESASHYDIKLENFKKLNTESQLT
jgi:bacillithiol system protein YtxJ